VLEWLVMDTWTPLFSSIIRSSIWSEPLHVRVVWVTLLAMKDKAGFVESTMPGIQRFAAVTIEECRDAIRVLEEPDPESKSSEHEGRRIQRVEGGWLILGHERYLKKMKEVTQAVNNAKRQREWRARVSKLSQAHTLPGEVTADKAERNGSPQEVIDRIGDASLPERDGECPV
jgi:hypothetical protein